jgi:hypothetical protein
MTNDDSYNSPSTASANSTSRREGGGNIFLSHTSETAAMKNQQK